MYCELCTVYCTRAAKNNFTVRCELLSVNVYYILRTVYCALHTVCCVLCSGSEENLYRALCPLFCEMYTVYNTQFTVYCTVHCVLCPVYYSRTAKKIFTVCCLLFSVKCIITIHRVLCVVYTYAVCCNYNLVSVWCILCAELLPPWTDQASVGSVNLVMKNIGGKVFY